MLSSTPLKSQITKLFKKFPFLKYVTIAFTGSFVASVGQYVFNLLMTRILTIEDLGVFQSFNSILTILSIITTVLGYRITSIAAELKGKNKIAEITQLFHFTKREITKVGIGIGFLVILATPLIKRFLHIDNTLPIILTAISVPGTLLLYNARGILTGLLLFKDNSINLSVEVAIRIAIGVGLALIGFRFNAPIAAAGAAAYLGYILIYKPLFKHIPKDPPKKGSKAVRWKNLLQYTFPTFIATAGIALFYTVDILIVRYYFGDTDPELVGNYATLSLLGRIIFFGAISIAQAIFPVASQEHAKGIVPFALLKQATLLTLLFSGAVTLLYALAPEFIITILFGKKYLSIAPLLGWFAIAATLLAVMNLFTNFYLSTKRRLIIATPIIGVFIFIGITLFQHDTIGNIIFALITGSGTSVLLYTLYTLFFRFLNKEKRIKTPTS